MSHISSQSHHTFLNRAPAGALEAALQVAVEVWRIL
jgi:hypothetical protein